MVFLFITENFGINGVTISLILPLIVKINSEKCDASENRMISQMQFILEFWVNICYVRITTLLERMAG